MIQLVGSDSIQEVYLTLMAVGIPGLDPIPKGFCRFPLCLFRRKLIDLTVGVNHFMSMCWLAKAPNRRWIKPFWVHELDVGQNCCSE